MSPLLLLLLPACEPTITTQTLTDEGTVCVNDDGLVEVTFPGCLSSSCDTLVSATCEATYADGVVEVHAEAVIESQGDECTADCGIIQATCELPTVDDPSTATFAYAGESTPLDAECAGF